MGQLPVETRVCIAVNTVLGRSILLSFVGIIESLESLDADAQAKLE